MMRSKTLAMRAAGASFAIAAAVAITTPADATLLQFTMTGDYQTSFVLDSDPTPFAAVANSYFAVSGVTIPGVTTSGNVFFYNTATGGALRITDHANNNQVLVSTDGAQLYSGTEADPTLLTGDFALTQFHGTGTYSLSIEALPSPAPEAATWAMFIGGFGLVGSAMRRRKLAVSFG